MFSFAPTITVLDCGASRVLGGRFVAKAGGLCLESLACEPLDPTRETGDWLRATATAVRRIAPRMRGAGPVTLVLPAHLVLTKFIKTPPVDAAKREKVIRFEAQQNIPCALADVVWSHAVANESAQQVDVMLCAAKRDAVEALCTAAEDAGLAPRVLLPSVCAFGAAIVAAVGTEPTLFVNLGARSATLILRESQRSLVRTFALAPIQDAAADARAAEMLATRLGHEITRSLVHFQRDGEVPRPVRVVVTGGSARGAGLIDALAARVGLPVQVFEPLSGLELGPAAVEAGASERAWQLADLVGAARLQFDGGVAVNLRPPRLVAEESARRRRPWLSAAAVLAAMAFAPPLYHYRQWEAALREKTAALETEIAPLRSREAANRANLERLAKLQEQLATLHAVVARRTAWRQFLAELQDRFMTVEDVWLDRVALVSDPAAASDSLRIAVSGRMLDRANPLANVSPDIYRRVTGLLTSVADCGYVSAVENERFDNRERGVLRFDVVLVADRTHPL